MLDDEIVEFFVYTQFQKGEFHDIFIKIENKNKKFLCIKILDKSKNLINIDQKTNNIASYNEQL